MVIDCLLNANLQEDLISSLLYIKTNELIIIKNKKNSSVDMWGLGCLIWETYNGTLNISSQLKVTGQVSSLLF